MLLSPGTLLTLQDPTPPSLSLDLLSTSSLTSPQGYTLLHSRGGGATQYDSSGLLTFGPENLLTYSDDASNGAWTKNNVTVTSYVGALPAGLSDAKIVTMNAITNEHWLTRSTMVIPVGVPITYSCVAKDNGALLYIGGNSAVVGTQEFAYFDLRTGIIPNSGSASNAQITPLGNGFYRCSITTSSISISTTANIFIKTEAYGTTGRGASSTGDGVSGIIIGGMMANRGRLIPLTPTTTTTAYYGPRFDYHPTTLLPRGLRIEEARTNVITYSNAFSDASWTKVDISSTNQDATGPDGIANSAWTVTQGVAGSAAIGKAVSITAGDVIVKTFFVKKGNNDWTAFQLLDNTFAHGCRVWFNKATGLFGTTSSVGTGTFISARAVQLPNGFYRVEVVFTTDAAATSATLYTIEVTADASLIRTNNATRIQYGAQGELLSVATANASTARMTSYIPTGSASVTRSEDIITTPIGSYYNETEGTLFCEVEIMFRNTNASGRSFFLYISDNSTNNSHGLGANAGNGDGTYGTSAGGVSTAALGAGAITTDTIYKFAYRYRANDFRGCTNGTLTSADTSGAVPTGITQHQLGRRLTVNNHNGWIRQHKIWPVGLPDATLQGLTS